MSRIANGDLAETVKERRRNMSRVETSIRINASPEEVFSFHDEPHNLIKVLPPYLRIEIVQAPPRLYLGALVRCVMHVGPLRFDWKIEVTEHDSPFRFADSQKSGPFRRYVHTHLIQPDGKSTRLTDTIEYELPIGPFAELANRVGFQNRLLDVLKMGQQSTKELLEKRAY
jgi:ligand-binding SRPBCC domain-containing protein